MKDIEVLEGFLTEDAFKAVKEEVHKLFSSPTTTYRVNLSSWPEDIVRDSAPVLVYDFTKVSKVYRIMEEACERQVGKTPSSVLLYQWSNLSYIPWHNDEQVGNAGTLYLDENWDANWGGAYLYETSDREVKALFPFGNRLVLQYNHTPHATTLTSKVAPIRRTLQMFFE
jgi:hypothetical protein